MASGGSLPFGAIEALDAELARVSRSAGELQLRVGTLLDTLVNTNGHHELGFSGLESYALERCERSVRWVQETRGLARRLSKLPLIRAALVSGRIGFSMAQVLAKYATAGDESTWLAEAAGHTVRQMRLFGKDRASKVDVIESMGAMEEQLATLTVTVAREDGWLFECAGMMAKGAGAVSSEELFEALLAEGTTALLDGVDKAELTRYHDFEGAPAADPQRAWNLQLAAWRDQAEQQCEATIQKRRIDGSEHTDGSAPAQLDSPPVAPDAPGVLGTPEALDAQLRESAAELATWDLRLGRLLEAFWKADGRRRQGYATDRQYARERLGMSLSSVKERRWLAQRMDKLPRLARAVEERKVGYEAAKLIASIATPDTVAAWIARAVERTLRQFREEVDAAKMLVRLDVPDAGLPPTEETMRTLEAMERAIVSGAAFAGGVGSAQGTLVVEHDGSKSQTSTVDSDGSQSERSTVDPDGSQSGIL